MKNALRRNAIRGCRALPGMHARRRPERIPHPARCAPCNARMGACHSMESSQTSGRARSPKSSRRGWVPALMSREWRGGTGEAARRAAPRIGGPRCVERKEMGVAWRRRRGRRLAVGERRPCQVDRPGSSLLCGRGWVVDALGRCAMTAVVERRSPHTPYPIPQGPHTRLATQARVVFDSRGPGAMLVSLR